MKKLILFLFVASLSFVMAGCKGIGKQSADDSQPDSVLTACAKAYNSRLPKEDGVFVLEKCEYDGKAVTISMRTTKSEYDITDPENMKWLPAMKLNEICTLDKKMIARLVQLNQPLQYAVYTDKEQKPYKTFALTAHAMKGRAASYGMLN